MKKLSDSALKQSNIAQNAGNATLIFKKIRGSMTPNPPSQPADPPNWPAGLKLIENPVLIYMRNPPDPDCENGI